MNAVRAQWRQLQNEGKRNSLKGTLPLEYRIQKSIRNIEMEKYVGLFQETSAPEKHFPEKHRNLHSGKLTQQKQWTIIMGNWGSKEQEAIGYGLLRG